LKIIQRARARCGINQCTLGGGCLRLGWAPIALAPETQYSGRMHWHWVLNLACCWYKHFLYVARALSSIYRYINFKRSHPVHMWARTGFSDSAILEKWLAKTGSAVNI
jgi:hypothetical protein